ncbi:MAG: ion transporter [Lachnospiraceae bacterium]|nr:ion transporter [Lachnospiraceae bacterium]
MYNTGMKKKDLFKKRIFEIIQIGNTSDMPSRTFDIILVAAIILNILTLFLETFDSLSAWSDVFFVTESVTILFFCIEYALRIWTAEFLFPGRSRAEATWRFLISFDGIVDLLTILPFFWMSGFVAFRMLRVVRIFHLFRVNTNYDSFNVIKSVIYEKRNQLASSIFIIILLMLASSLCMYSAEHDTQPEAFANAFSGLWWSVSTMLTVGYGDIYPVTIAGQIMAIIIAFLGVGVVAIPTGIISAGFVEQYTKAQNAASSLEVSINTVIVDIDSKWIGLTVREIEEQYHMVIVVVRRNNTLLQPGEDYRVQMKDVLAVYHKISHTA